MERKLQRKLDSMMSGKGRLGKDGIKNFVHLIQKLFIAYLPAFMSCVIVFLFLRNFFKTSCVILKILCVCVCVCARARMHASVSGLMFVHICTVYTYVYNVRCSVQIGRFPWLMIQRNLCNLTPL